MISRLLPFDYAVRNLGRAPIRLMAILLGNALVVLVVLAAAAFVEGMGEALSPNTGSSNVILLGVGSEESIERSEIPAATAGVVAASVAGIRETGGAPHVSAEVLSALILHESPESTAELRAAVRGVTAGAYLVHPTVEIVAGRAPMPGSQEMLAGRLAEAKLGLREGSLAVGKSLWFGAQQWTVVGRFQAKGTPMEGELWLPLNDLKIATKRESISCVVVSLGSAEFADVDAFTKTRIDLELAAVSESDYYAGLRRFYLPVRVMIWVTALLASIAGIVGGLNTLYAAFAARSRELGMLQSLGYPRRAIALNLVQESLLGAAGAVVLAVCIGWLLLDGAAVRFSMGVFVLHLTDRVLLLGAVSGLALGLVGALPPAWRCLRMPIPQALKSH
jgi:putative ABC transport system permease protein